MWVSAPQLRLQVRSKLATISAGKHGDLKRLLVLITDGEAIYFCGNSLGLLAKKARQYMLEELDVWGSRWVMLHPKFPARRVKC